MARAAHPRGGSGQASIELLAGLPALALAGFVAVQLLLTGYSLSIADGAAEAGAIAEAAGNDPERAARDALPAWARGRATVSAEAGRVTVELRPPSPLPTLSERLEVSSEAWARGPGEPG
jgi:hypothetical protein